MWVENRNRSMSRGKCRGLMCLWGGLSGCMNLHVMTSLPLNIRRAQCLDWGGDTTSVFVCE
jgi:hypothetical protein